MASIRRVLLDLAQPANQLRQPVQSTAPAFSPCRVRSSGQEAWRRTCRQRIHLLDAVRLHAVLPTRSRRLPTRNLQRAGLLSGPVGAFRHPQGALPFDPVLCQRTPPRSAVRGIVLDRLSPLPPTTGAGRQEAQIPLQQQTPVVGFDHYLAVLDPVSVGQIPSRQWWGQSHVLLDHDDYLASLRPTRPSVAM